jgi:hypothetical protein
VIRTIDVEIVRPGEPHNQLLSPLVNYTALCGRHLSTTVAVPFEHRAVVDMLRPLQEPESADPRDRVRSMEELGKLLAEVLAPIGGISRDLSSAGGDWVELRLLLTPMELSLLPFELLQTNTARGDLADALQRGHRNVVLTRGIRGSGRVAPEWPVVPRILFIAASPGGITRPPVESHALALRKALDPWILPSKEKDAPPDTSALLTILTNATIDDIRRACADTRYDWVHLLVHGGSTGADGRKTYGIVLDGLDHPNVVSGAQLAAALTPIRGGRPGVPPSMVTLCTCHSGRSDNVVYPGASVAQEIHAHGVPVVVASQFPMTFRASVIVADELYRQLLEHGDPRIAVAACRNRLRQWTAPDKHPDEASIVAYCELGAEFAAAQRNLETRRVYRMMETAREWRMKGKAQERLTEASKRIDAVERSLAAQLTVADTASRDGATSERIPFKVRSAALRTEISELRGLQGSVFKRLAELEPAGSKGREDLLVQALRAYGRATEVNPGDHWVATQWLALDLITSKTDKSDDAHCLAWRNAVASAKKEGHLWKHGTLAELYLIAPALFGKESPWEEYCLSELQSLRQNHGPADDPYILESTKRQFERYHDWWAKDKPGVWLEIVQTAAKAVDIFSAPKTQGAVP